MCRDLRFGYFTGLISEINQEQFCLAVTRKLFDCLSRNKISNKFFTELVIFFLRKFFKNKLIAVGN